MNTRYTIKNFRVFDSEGVTVEIAPLTFLVGCNSSGKSSIVKSLSLLKSFFREEKTPGHPAVGSVIDFSVKPNDSLGSFRNAVRSGSREKAVTLQYDVYSKYIDDDVTVSLMLEDGDLGNAVVRQVRISLKDGPVIITAGKDDETGGNLVPLKEGFSRYLVAMRFREQNAALVERTVDQGRDLNTEEFRNEKEKILREAVPYCREDFLLKISRDRSVEAVKGLSGCEEPSRMFLRTGFLTNYALFDRMAGLTGAGSVRSFLRSCVRNKAEREELNRIIDVVCDDFEASGSKDFLAYFKDLENKELASPFVMLSCSGVLLESSSLYNSLLFVEEVNRMPVNGEAVKSLSRERVSYSLVRDMLAKLSAEEPRGRVFGRRGDSGRPADGRPSLYGAFREFVKLFFREVVNNDVTEGIDYISSSRIQVRRMYPMEDRNDFSDAVKRYFETRSRFMTLSPPIRCLVDNGDGSEDSLEVVSTFIPGSFMNKWLKVFKIGDHMSLEMDKNGLGLLLKVFRSESDRKGTLLADLGYGITQLFSILLQIEEMIMSSLYDRYHDKSFYGKHGIIISREKLTGGFAPRTVAIEEPEIHLHPRFQSLLAEMFLEAYRDYNIQFIVETHSEYLLRRIQTLVGSRALTPEEVSMIYVEDDEEARRGAQKVRRIPVKADGRLAAPFGPGFYDEADNLSMQLFTNFGS